jgi:hypothetical protein
MTQSWQATPRTSQRSQSTIMSGSVSVVIQSLLTVDGDPDNAG